MAKREDKSGKAKDQDVSTVNEISTGQRWSQKTTQNIA